MPPVPNIAALTPGVLLVLFLGVAVVAYNVGAAIESWRADEWTNREKELRESRLRITRNLARAGAYDRAAQAVTMWPHRVDRRADLARHLLSLATAPELGAPAPNPAATPEVEDAPTTRVSPGPAAAPVPERSLSPEPESQLNVMEGFL